VLDLFLAGAHGLGLTDLEYRQVLQMQTERAHRDEDQSKIAYDGHAARKLRHHCWRHMWDAATRREPDGRRRSHILGLHRRIAG